MESAAGLPHPQPKTSRATSQLAGSNAQDGEPGRIPGTQERWRAWNSNALARFAAPGRSYRDVETPHSYGALTPGVQPKIWVMIRPRLEDVRSSLARKVAYPGHPALVAQR